MDWFVDQAWLSSLPFVFHDLTYLSRHPGLNVAYWNLDERHLTRSDETILVNGYPLLFFHFSGYDRTNPTFLSKHSDVRVVAGSALDQICILYRSEIDGAAALRPKVTTLETLPCSAAKFAERIFQGSVYNDLSLIAPTAKLGLFSGIGRRVDFILGKLLA